MVMPTILERSTIVVVTRGKHKCETIITPRTLEKVNARVAGKILMAALDTLEEQEDAAHTD